MQKRSSVHIASVAYHSVASRNSLMFFDASGKPYLGKQEQIHKRIHKRSLSLVQSALLRLVCKHLNAVPCNAMPRYMTPRDATLAVCLSPYRTPVHDYTCTTKITIRVCTNLILIYINF